MTIFIQKGDPFMSRRQAIKRGLRHFEAEKAQWEREQGIFTESPEYATFAQSWLHDNFINEQNNLFNYQLMVYKQSVDRLSQYIKSEGKPKVTELQETGEFDVDTGEPIMEEVVVATEIEPIPLEVEVDIVNEETSEVIGTEFVDNPIVLKDIQGRRQAQFIVDNTPQEVKDFVG